MFKKFLTHKITRDKLDIFIRQYASDEFTLDIGCANSPYSCYFPNRVGFDAVPGQGVDVVGDAHRLPFESDKFDRILCTEVLEHLHSPHLAIAEMHRVLKPGGLLILSTRFIFPIHESPNDFYRYTKYGLQYLFRDWEIKELKEEVGTQQTLAVLLQRIGFQTTLAGGIFTKLLVFLTAKVIDAFPNLISKEFGDIRKETKEKNILVSGYYLVCKKK